MCSAGTPRSGQCSQGAGGAAFKPCLPAAAAPLPLRKVRFCWDFSLAARSSLLAGGRARRAAPWLHTATLHRPCRTWELLPRALGPAPSCTGAGASPVRLQRLGGELLRHCQPGDLVCLSHFLHHGLCLLKQEAFRFAVPVLPVGERVAPAPLQLFTGPAVCFAAPARALGLTRFPCAHKVGQLLALGIISRETKRRAASLSPPPPAGANLRRGSASGSSVVLLGGLCGCRKGGTLTSHPKKEASAGCLMQSQDRRGF